MTTRTFTALATALLALSFASAAHARCGGGHGGLVFHKASTNYSQSTAAKKRAAAHAAAQRRKEIAAAKARAAKTEQAVAAAATATEGTFVEAPSTSATLIKRYLPQSPVFTAAALKSAAAAGSDGAALAAEETELDVVASADTGCKRFIPAAGKTVSVDCN